MNIITPPSQYINQHIQVFKCTSSQHSPNFTNAHIHQITYLSMTHLTNF